jgi:hypothetical protein
MEQPSTRKMAVDNMEFIKLRIEDDGIMIMARAYMRLLNPRCRAATA